MSAKLQKQIANQVKERSNVVKLTITSDELFTIRYVTKMVCNLSGIDFELFEEEYLEHHQDGQYITAYFDPIINMVVYYIDKYTKIPIQNIILYFPHLASNEEDGLKAIKRITRYHENLLALIHTHERIGETIYQNLYHHKRKITNTVSKLTRVKTLNKSKAEIKVRFTHRKLYYNMLREINYLNNVPTPQFGLTFPKEIKHLHKPTELELTVDKSDFDASTSQ